ncbi:uncharacterized protein LOC143192992 [Rhynchophorus ferrugineus]|uniref:uncharacterized protein LOC143192992 n=1 Tax=Rhynchophorus ferrugineus TaxID=354439 RepID=UPI003FCD46CE
MGSIYYTFILLIAAAAVLGDSNEEHPPPGPLQLLMSRPTKKQIDDCMTENGLTKDEIKPPREKKEPTEKQLCFHKCIALSTGIITKDGEIVIDKIKDNISRDSEFPSSVVDELITCLKGLGEKINACGDMKKIAKCVPKRPE